MDRQCAQAMLHNRIRIAKNRRTLQSHICPLLPKWGRLALFTGLVFLLAGIGRLTSQSVGSSSAALSAKIALTGERIMHSNPAAADLDGDGDKEVVIGGQDGLLYVLAYESSTWQIVWARQTASDLVNAGAPTASPCVSQQGDIRSSPAVADLDNDGHQEIVISAGGDTGQHRNGGVLVYRYNRHWSFSVLPGWPQPRLDKVGSGPGASVPDGCWDGFWSTPSLGDLDSDGDLEVVVEGFDRHIHAWHHDGSLVAGGWPIYRYVDETDQSESEDCLLRGGWSSPALGDVDGDGLPEVVVGTDSPPWNCPANWGTIDYARSTVWAINGDSSNVPGWPVATQQTIQSSPAMGDIDGDGSLEIVVGSGEGIAGTGGYVVYAWHGNGVPLSGWPRPVAANVRSSPALGDLDRDGIPDVVIGCGTEKSESVCNQLYAWRGNGTPISGFPATLSAASLPNSPVLADYDGDGDVEVLVVPRDSHRVLAFRSNGLAETDSSMQADSTLVSSPLVDDVDGDGSLEVVIGGASDSSPTARGVVYIWDVAGHADEKRPWPMFHHNIQRTGSAYSIAGRVADVHSTPAAGVSVSIHAGVQVTTGTDGAYRFAGLDQGTYVLSPALTGRGFYPATRTATLPPSAIGQDFVILAGPVSATLAPDSPLSLGFTDTQGLGTWLDFPAGAASQSVTIYLTPTLASGQLAYWFTGHAFELTVFQGGVQQPGFVFQKPIGITIYYSDLDIGAVRSEGELVLEQSVGSGWQNATQTCSPASSATIDQANNHLHVPVCRAGTFGLFGPTNQAYLPAVMLRQ